MNPTKKNKTNKEKTMEETRKEETVEKTTDTWKEEAAEYENLQSQLCLMGNIVQHPELLVEYEGILDESDFTDDAVRIAFAAYKEAYRRYEEVPSPELLNVVITDFWHRDPKARQIFPGKGFSKFLNDVSKLGTKDAPLDSWAFRGVKKGKLIRALNKIGVSTKSICEQADFHLMTAADILDSYYTKLDSLAEHATFDTSEEFSGNVVERARSFLREPEMGITTPFEFINEHMHGLCPNDLTMIGGLTNTGKGRLLMFLLVYLVCVEKQKVYLISNEMTSSDMFKAMVTTLVNMPQLRELHAKSLHLCQNDIVQMRFPDANGEVMTRGEDESPEIYEQRLIKDSPIYNDYVDVLTWFQENFADRFHFVSAMDDYSDKRIRAEIRRAERMGCTIVAYDTMKNYMSSEWGDFVKTATTISEGIKLSKNGIHGIVTFQLTDDARSCNPEDLSPTRISNAKNIVHVADNMLMFKHLSDYEKNRYTLYWEEDGRDYAEAIKQETTVTGFKIVKTRRGSGKDRLYGVQTSLDLNRWKHVGELCKEKDFGWD